MSEWTQIFIRSIIFLLVLFVMTKLLGKKQISEISFFEYISGITIGSIAGEVIMGLDGQIGHGIMAIAVFSLITLLVDLLSIKSKKFREMIDGKGTILIKDGKVLEDNLKKEKYTAEDLGSLLRGKNVFNVADVEFALLEPNGEISVLLKKENRPLTAKDLNLPTTHEKEPETVIMDGEIIYDSLASARKSKHWLHQELDKLGVTLENVFLGQVNSYGELTVDLYDDKINVPQPQSRLLLMASLKKCQADLELYALATEAEKAKAMYEKNAKKLDQAITALTPFLQ